MNKDKLKRDPKSGRFIKTTGKVKFKCEKCGKEIIDYPSSDRKLCSNCRGWWSDKEIEVLKENYETATTEELRKMFLNRTPDAIQHKAQKLGLNRSWAKAHRKYNIPKEELDRMYNKEMLSTIQISEKTGISKSNVHHLLKRHGIKTRRQGEVKHYRFKQRIPKEKLYELYWGKNMSQKEIAEKLNTSQTNIYMLMREYGIPRRDKMWGLKENVKPTKPERKLIEIIERYNLPYKYVGDGKFWIENINPDFIECNGKKQVIEVFGDYWHTERARNWKEEEFGRKAILSQYGYNCMVIWEHELTGRGGKKLPEEEIVERIRMFKK